MKQLTDEAKRYLYNSSLTRSARLVGGESVGRFLDRDVAGWRSRAVDLFTEALHLVYVEHNPELLSKDEYGRLKASIIEFPPQEIVETAVAHFLAETVEPDDLAFHGGAGVRPFRGEVFVEGRLPGSLTQ